MWERGTPVINRDATEIGRLTGGYRKCAMKGCLGMRVAVRWPGRPGEPSLLTYPCTQDMTLFGTMANADRTVIHQITPCTQVDAVKKILAGEKLPGHRSRRGG